MNPILLLSLIAGALAIDDRAGWQSLLAHPVFCALIVGAVTGEYHTAIAVGLLLELTWLSILPMRGVKRPDMVVGAIAGCGAAAILVQLTADPRAGLVVGTGTLFGVLAGELNGRIGTYVFSAQSRWVDRTAFDEEPPAEIIRRLRFISVGALSFIFVVEAVLAALWLLFAFWGTELLTRVASGALAESIEVWHLFLPALGAAALIHLYWHQHLKRVLILSAVLSVLVLWLN